MFPPFLFLENSDVTQHYPVFLSPNVGTDNRRNTRGRPESGSFELASILPCGSPSGTGKCLLAGRSLDSSHPAHPASPIPEILRQFSAPKPSDMGPPFLPIPPGLAMSRQSATALHTNTGSGLSLSPQPNAAFSNEHREIVMWSSCAEVSRLASIRQSPPFSQ